MYPLFVIFFGLAIYRSQTDLRHFESMVSDNGLFQWMIFATLIFASVMCFYRASILKPFRGSVFSTFQVLLGIVFLAFALDEISWTQIIFNFKSPEFFYTHNSKLQLNFHNLILVGFHVNHIVFTLSIKILATLYFLIIPYLYPRSIQIKNFVNQYAIAIPRYTHTVAYVIMGIMTTFIPSDFIGY